MPTYEYACRECGHRFDTVQSFTDDPLRVCPSCGGELRKVFSAAGIIFKGSGYYVTDSRAAASAGNGAKKGDGADTPGSSSDAPSPDAKGEKSAPAKSGSDTSKAAAPKKTSGDAAASSKSS